MMIIEQLETFSDWLSGLKDGKAKIAITSRIRRIELGLMGDVKPIGSGLSELRVDVGQGYRVYMKQRGNKLIIVLCGSQKKDQQKQINKAKELYKHWRVENEH